MNDGNLENCEEYDSLSPTPSLDGREVTGHNQEITAIAVSPNGRRVASGSVDGKLCLWDTSTGEQLCAIENESPISTIRFSRDGKLLGYWAQALKVVDVVEKKELWQNTVFGGISCHITFSSSNHLLTCNSCGELILWDGRSGNLISQVASEFWEAGAIALSPNGRLVTASNRRGIRTWDTKYGKKSWTLEDPAQALAYSSDGKRLAATSYWNVTIWDVATLEKHRVLSMDFAPTYLMFSRDDKKLKTSHGTILLESSSSTTDAADSNITGYALKWQGWPVWGDWILLNGKRLMAVDMKYRSTLCCVWKNIVVIGFGSGAVLILKFREA